MGRQRILYYISIEKRGKTWEDRESCITSLQRKVEIHGKTENHMSSLQRKEEIHGKTENPMSHLYREKRKYMGRQDNPVLHLYREKRKNMGRQRILYHISIDRRGNTWEDRESYVTSLQRKEEIHGKTRESCITSLQRKEEKHGKTENPVSHLYREKRKFMGRQRIICHISIEKRGNTWEDRESYVTSLQRKEEIHGKTRESCIISLQRKEEIHGKTENPMSHLYR